jgi:hypothetical protein
VTRNTPLLTAVHRRVRIERPPSKLRASIVSERLLDFLLSVHHERPVLRDRFSDGAPLQQQELSLAIPIFDENIPVRDQLDS